MNNISEKPFELLVFDWDGTLMDSVAHIAASMARAIGDLDLPELPAAEVRNVIGLGLAEAVAQLYPDIDADIQRQLADRYRYHYLADDPCFPFDGAEAVLRDLSQQGYLMAVATGKGRRGLDRVLDSTGFRPLFDVTRCADETRSKPHPQMLQEIMDCLNVEPANTLMIGDTEYDLQMANNAGVAPLGVSYGVHSVARLQAHGPHGCLDAIRELPEWLDSR